jgi:hypothetical protein
MRRDKSVALVSGLNFTGSVLSGGNKILAFPVMIRFISRKTYYVVRDKS